MKTQVHNKGELSAVKVDIEKDVVLSLKEMVKNSKLSADDIICIALKRFIHTHADYLDDKTPMIE